MAYKDTLYEQCRQFVPTWLIVDKKNRPPQEPVAATITMRRLAVDQRVDIVLTDDLTAPFDHLRLPSANWQTSRGRNGPWHRKCPR